MRLKDVKKEYSDTCIDKECLDNAQSEGRKRAMLANVICPIDVEHNNPEWNKVRKPIQGLPYISRAKYKTMSHHDGDNRCKEKKSHVSTEEYELFDSILDVEHNCWLLGNIVYFSTPRVYAK